MKARFWKTSSGVLVYEDGRRAESGRVKVAAYKWPTGGFHGWIWLRRCTRAKAPPDAPRTLVQSTKEETHG